MFLSTIDRLKISTNGMIDPQTGMTSVNNNAMTIDENVGVNVIEKSKTVFAKYVAKTNNPPEAIEPIIIAGNE